MSNLKVMKWGASWCGPCRMLDPILHELEKELVDVEFEFIDVDENPESAGENGIMGVPRVMIFKNGEKVDDFAGFKPKEFIVDLIEKHKK